MNHLDLQAAWEAWEAKQAHLRWKRNMFALHYGRTVPQLVGDYEDYVKNPPKTMDVTVKDTHRGVRIWVEHKDSDSLGIIEVTHSYDTFEVRSGVRGNWSADKRRIKWLRNAMPAPLLSALDIRALKERYCQLRIPFGPEREAFRERYLT